MELNQKSEIENVNIKAPYERAQFVYRFTAYFVDGMVCRFLSKLITTVLPQPYSKYDLILILIVYIGYFSYYPYKNSGQTLGKKWNRVRVVDLEGNNLPLWHLVIRELVRISIFIIAFKIFGYWGILIGFSTYLFALTNDKRALHDIVARTQVIKVAL